MVTLKNVIFRVLAPCFYNRHFGGTYRLSYSGLLLVAVNVVPSSLILSTLKEAARSSETSVLTRSIWHNIPEDGILYQLNTSSMAWK
jgi:hypothetical protein